MFEKFSEEAIKLIMHAQEEARLLKHKHVGCEHLLLGFVALGTDSLAQKLLTTYGWNLKRMRAEVAKECKKGTKASPEELLFDAGAKVALEKAFRATQGKTQTLISANHILFGLIDESDNVATKVLNVMGGECHTLCYLLRSQILGFPQILEAPGEPEE